jgi:outer membrane protein assembly factor BamB
MDGRPLLRMLAIVVLVIAAALGLRARRRWPARRASGIVAGGLTVLALAGLLLSALDVLAPRAPVPGALSVYYLRDGLEAASAATGTVRWRYSPPPSCYTPSLCLSPTQVPTFANGVFYLGVGSTISAVRASDGTQLWNASVDGLAESEMPAVDHGMVFATSVAGVFALRAVDGSQLWHLSRSATPAFAPSSPQAANGLVYVALFSAGPLAAPGMAVYALGANDGAIRWTANVPATSFASLTVVDGIVYAEFGVGPPSAAKTAVYALGAGDGAVHWTYTVDQDRGAESLTVADGAVYLRSQQLGLVALDASAGRLLWQRQDVGAGPPPVTANGVAYLSAHFYAAGVVLALDARDGRDRWRTVLDDADAYVSIAGQMVYVGGGSVHALRASDGHVVWRYSAESGGAQFFQPVVTDGVVFLGSSSYGVHLFGIGSNDFLNALDARTGKLYWRSSGTVEGAPMFSS